MTTSPGVEHIVGVGFLIFARSDVDASPLRYHRQDQLRRVLGGVVDALAGSPHIGIGVQIGTGVQVAIEPREVR